MDLSSRRYPFQRQPRCDLPAEFRWLRRNAPVSQVTMFDGGQAWLVSGLDQARAALADPRFSRRMLREVANSNFAAEVSQADVPFDFGISIADPPGHGRWRRIVNKAFGARQAESLRRRIGEVVDELLDRVEAARPPVDLMREFAFRLPIHVLCALFGLPGDNRELHDWANAIRNVDESLGNFGTAMNSLGRYAEKLVAERRENASDDVVGTLLRARDADGRGLSDDELVSTVLLLVVGAYETTGVQLGNGLYALLRHPDQVERLRHEPDLVPGAVEEVLRYAQASTGFAAATRTTDDVELGGVTIPAGSTVFVSIDSANRDEAYFECPDTFDVTRPTAGRHIAFGSGAHFCIGAQLARVQLQEAIGRLVGRFPRLRLATDPDDVAFTSNLFAFYPSELPVTWRLSS